MSNKVVITDYFVKGMRALPPDRQRRAIAAIEKFMRDAAVPSLDFRPLKGKAGFFIIDANSGDRIILKRVEADTYEAMDVGSHDNVYRRWDR